MLSKSQVPVTLSGDVDDEELLTDVLRYIPYNRRTLCALRCVSKSYRSVVQRKGGPWSSKNSVMLSRFGQCAIFNALEDEEGNSDFPLYSISPLGRKFRNPSALVLARHHARVATGLTTLALHYAEVDADFFANLSSLSRLRRLELIYCRALTSLSEASQVSSLEELEVAFCPLKSDAVKDLDLPHLRHLKLRYCHDLTLLDGIQESTAAALENLYLEGCGIYDDTCSQFFGRLSDRLRELYCNCVPLDAAFSALPESTLRGLRTLHAADTKLSNETFAAIAPLLVTCEYLSVEGCEMTDVSPIGKLTELLFLDVSKLLELDGLEAVGECAKLELFRAHSCMSLMSLDALKTCPRLRVLDIPSTTVTDNALLALRGAANLDTVVLQNCTYVTDINIFHSCPNIRRLFCANSGIRDSGITLLSHCDRLEVLDISNTMVLNVNLLVECPALQLVSVFGTPMMRDGISAFAGRDNIQVISDPLDQMDPTFDY